MQPDPFRTIIGHAAAKTAVLSALSGNRLPHAYLFLGPDGIGKRLFAKALAEAFLGVSVHGHPDVTYLAREADEKTGKMPAAIKIEQVRAFIERLSLSAASGKKVAFIEEADRLNGAAANALLKTLEEPRGDTLLLLVAEDESRIPETIRSRCQMIRLHGLSREELAEAIEKRGSTKKDATALAALALGRPGLALRLLKDGAYRAEQATATEQILRLASAPIYERIRAVQDLLPKEEGDKLEILERTLESWEGAARDGLLSTVSCDDLARASGIRASPERLTAVIARIHEARRAARQNGNPQLALEHVLIGL